MDRLEFEKHREGYSKILIEESHIPFVVMDPETLAYIDCNRAAVRIFGCQSHEEVVSKSTLHFSTPTQYNGRPSEEVLRDNIRTAIENGFAIFEWRHQRPNGQVWDGEVHLMSFDLKGKNLIQFSLLDITDQRRVLEALHENEAKYKTLFESANDAIFLMDQNVFIDCNAKTLQIYKCTREQIIAHSPVDFSPLYQPDGQLSVEKAREKINAAFGGTPQFFEWVHCHFDRTPFDAEVSLNRVIIKGEMYLQAIVRDVSERKKAERVIRESDEQFKIITRNTNDVIWIRDMNLRYKYISPSCYKILGYTVEEAMELSYGQITTPEYVELVSRTLAEELARDGQPNVDPNRTRILEIQEVRKDGSLIWTETQASFIRDERGKVTGILGVTRDITERKVVEHALRESEERFRITAEKTGELIYEYNIKTGRIYWSGAVETITGYPQQEFRTFNIDGWGELIHPDDRQLAFAELDRAIESNGDYSVEYRFKRKNGEYIYVEDRGVVLPPDSTGVKRMFGTMNNITERKLAQEELKNNEKYLKEQNEEYFALNEELTESNIRIAEINAELREAKEKAEESDRLKSAFLANMSHEIRTPMNGVIGFSEMIIQPDVSDENRKLYADIIRNSCNQLMAIINDIIDISKIETNQVTVNENVVSLNQLLTNNYILFKNLAEAKNLTLKLAPTFTDNIEIITDEVKTNQILNNLINNAIKFTHVGYVEFGCTIKDGFIEFFVKDTGIGIDPAHFEIIFERFRQIDMGSTRNYSGTGLGLSISKAFVEVLGGRIWLESVPGEGSTFYFTIPFRAHVKAAEPARVIPNVSGPTPSVNILVAEDEDVNFLYVELLLTNLGFRVIRAEDGQQAIDLVKATPELELILMDIKMPGVNGVEATKVIKSLKPRIPIIATTAYAMGGDKERFLGAGCDDYISKPIRSADLIALVRKYITR